MKELSGECAVIVIMIQVTLSTVISWDDNQRGQCEDEQRSRWRRTDSRSFVKVTYGTWCRTAVCSGSAFPIESSYGVFWRTVQSWRPVPSQTNPRCVTSNCNINRPLNTSRNFVGVSRALAPVYINPPGVPCALIPMYINSLRPRYGKFTRSYGKFMGFCPSVGTFWENFP